MNIEKNEVDKFIEKHKDDAGLTEVNLTFQQIEIIEGLAVAAGTTFENMAMILIHMTLKSMDQAAGEFMLEEQAKRN